MLSSGGDGDPDEFLVLISLLRLHWCKFTITSQHALADERFVIV